MRNYPLLALTFLFVAASCSLEKVAPEVPSETNTIVATCESGSRTILMPDQASVYWTPGDEINIYFGEDAFHFTSLCKQPSKTSSFVSDKAVIFAGIEESQKIWGYYPYNEDNTFDGSGITATIPVRQTATAGSFAPGSFPSMGSSTSAAVPFYNICGGVCFTVQREGVSEVVFKANGGQTLAGKVKLGFNADERPEVQQVIEGSDSVVLSAPVDSTFKVGEKYFLSALPGTLSQGFTMSFSTGGANGVRTSTKSSEIKRSVFGDLGVADAGVTYKTIVDEGVTLFGYVKCGTTPIKDVVVSDGVLCTKTDKNGLYQLKSAKKNGLVFISIPAYYCVAATNTQPQFYKQLTLPTTQLERKDFALYSDPGQYHHTRYLYGDIHIHQPSSEVEFAKFAKKINAELSKPLYKTPYGLTLGDMTWDWFWYHDPDDGYHDYWYQIPEFMRDIKTINGLQIFYTVGNHDHDMKYQGNWWNSNNEYETTGEDWTCEIPYRAQQGPTCYSCNIGSVHYVSMDDAITIDDGTGTKSGRGCKLGFTDVDLEWLKQDMSYVDSSVPVVLTVHIPFTTETGSFRGTTGHTLAEMLAPFKGRSGKLLVISAHLHRMHNHPSKTTGGITFEEWNMPAVCGYFWRTSINGWNLCTDGVPGGYRVLEFDGPNIVNSQYFATESPVGEYYPFRAYDRNTIKLKSNKYSTAGGFDVENKDNYVYLYVWDWNPDWKISMYEVGAGYLTPERLTDGIYDPLITEANILGKLSGAPALNYKTFRAKATSATSVIQITVTDKFGKQAHETMVRPKTFSYEACKKEMFEGYYYDPQSAGTSLEEYTEHIYQY